MPKKVLAIYYSQSGQLGEIVDNFTEPLIRAGASVEKLRIRPAVDYPFPWTGERFYSVMPDCVMGVTQELAPFTFGESSYDLIILGYQAWFLFPGIPSNSLLQHPAFKALVRDTPVITITGARNMWLNAFEQVKRSLLADGANLVGNIALVDKHPNVVSFVTIFHWLLGGKKDRYLNIFPPPGVSDTDIANANTFGTLVVPHLLGQQNLPGRQDSPHSQTDGLSPHSQWEGLQESLVSHQAVPWKYPLWLLESTAIPTYHKWARLIVKKKQRTPWLAAFKYYLLVALFLGAPILLIIDGIFIRPFSSKRINRKKQYYLALN